MNSMIQRFFLTLSCLLLVALPASALPPPMPLPEQGLVLNDVTLLVPGQRMRRSMALRVSGDVISEISAAAPNPDTQFAGMYVLPGLVDMHVHWPALMPGNEEQLFAFLYLYHGVTSVRSMGDMKAGQSFDIRRDIQRGNYPGPRVFTCGYMVDGPNPRWQEARVVSSAADARMLVAELKAAGADCIKVYDGIQPPVLTALRESAHAAGLPLVGHVPHSVPYDQARLDDMQHMRGLHPAVSGSMPPYPFYLRSWARSDQRHIQQVVSTIRRLELAVTPTLIAKDRLLASQDYATLSRQAEYGDLPHYYSAALWSTDKGINAARFMDNEDFAMVRHALDEEMAMVLALHKAAVPIHVGSDAGGAPGVVPGVGLHQEMALLHSAGLPARKVVRAATVTARQALGSYSQGLLSVGAPADFVILEHNPIDNLTAFDSIVAVVKDGRLYTRTSMNAQLKKYLAANHSLVQRELVSPLARVIVNYMVERELQKQQQP